MMRSDGILRCVRCGRLVPETRAWPLEQGDGCRQCFEAEAEDAFWEAMTVYPWEGVK